MLPSSSFSISIHALREEGDGDLLALSNSAALFLSTPSARRATPASIPTSRTQGISIHALREEGDWDESHAGMVWDEFLSTPSARRATGRLCLTVPIPTISIHALREEGDPSSSPLAIASANFYPRPPRGGRHRHCTRGHRPRNFYPRPPRGGRPREQIPLWMPARISIHALREEGDLPFCPASSRRGQFLSTPSARRATCPVPSSLSMTMISIHALREEGDTSAGITYTASTISIHALREEGDQSPTR